ncbi:MAG: CBS domain-containing protein [Aigarchaeota archaeon]|nr:CBS domain-containing protein [Aigarchaeota archaeon]
MVRPTTLAEDVLVRGVMSSPVVEVKKDETTKVVAEKMKKYHVGSVVVVEEGKPLGIITKRDLVDKVLADDLKPSDVPVTKIMSSPLHTVSPDEDISSALRKMTRLKVSRLAVVYKDRLAGMVSVKDILQVTPEILEIIRERMRIQGKADVLSKEARPTEGYCDSCGEWSDLIIPINGRFICEDCRLDVAEERKKEE